MSSYLFDKGKGRRLRLSTLCFKVLTRFVSPRVVVECLLVVRRRVFTLLARVYLPIVTRERLRDGRGPWRTETFDGPDRIERPDPILIGREPDELARIPRAIALKAPFVSVINGAFLIGASALALDAQRRILMESVGPDFDDGSPGFFALPLSSLLSPLMALADVVIDAPLCSLVTSFGWIYGHWLIEGLPRLEGYEHYRNRSGTRPLLLIEEHAAPWKLQSLQLMGYGEGDLLRWSGRTTRVKTLVLPSIRRQAGWPEPRACEWLRERLIGGLPQPAPSAPAYAPRVLISRGAAAGRRILNEDELMEALRPLGFACYQTDAMHFADEVRLFSGAEIIISVHGSGLMNAVLSTRKPLVIDIFDDFWTTEFIKLAAAIGARYACVRCQSVKGTAAGRQADSDCLVDVGAIVRLITEAHP